MSRQSTQKHLEGAGGEEVSRAKSKEQRKETVCFLFLSVGPAAVHIAAEKNLSTAAANGAVRLVTVVVVHVGHLQVHVLNTHRKPFMIYSTRKPLQIKSLSVADLNKRHTLG